MKVTIHVGLDKTGTTAIQKWFMQNAGVVFKENAVRYPAVGRKWGHHILVANYCGFGLPSDIRRLSEHHDTMAEIETFYKELQGRDVFLSTEHFSYGISQAAGQKLKTLFAPSHDVRIFLVLRLIPAWLRSKYSESVKWGYRGSFEDYVSNLSKGMAGFAGIINFWRETFGDEQVVVKLYDVIKTDLIGETLGVLGSSIPNDALTPKRKDNPSVGFGDLEVIRRCVQAMELDEGIQAYEFFRFYDQQPRPGRIAELNDRAFIHSFDGQQQAIIKQETDAVLECALTEHADFMRTETARQAGAVSQVPTAEQWQAVDRRVNRMLQLYEEHQTALRG